MHWMQCIRRPAARTSIDSRFSLVCQVTTHHAGQQSHLRCRVVSQAHSLPEAHTPKPDLEPDWVESRHRVDTSGLSSLARMAAHMGMFEVKGQVWSVHGQFSGRWFGSKV